MARIHTLALLVAALALTTCGGDTPSRPKTVIVISIDSLRPDRLGCYGLDRDTSPTIDRLASKGARFSCVSSTTSWTLPSHAALFTGLPDRVHRCESDVDWLDPSRRTIAEAFANAGYRTAGFFSGPYLHPCFKFEQGFRDYHDCTSYSQKTMTALLEAKVPENWMTDSHRDITNEIVLRKVTEWLESTPDGPRFAFIHLWDVHYDYIAPKRYRSKFTRPDYRGPVQGADVDAVRKRPDSWTDADVEHFIGLYDAEIRWTDDTIARLLAAFEAAGCAPEDTVISITADHGEAFYEHGTHGHRYSLDDAEVRIPWVLHAPGRVPAGVVIDRQASLIDVAPTVMALAGLDPLPDAWGRSFTPLIAEPNGAWRDADVLTELVLPGRHLFGIRTPTWKLVVNLSTGTFDVYDLVNDPDARTALAEDAYPIGRDALEKRFVETIGRLDAAREKMPRLGERPRMDDLTERQLRTLGYLK